MSITINLAPNVIAQYGSDVPIAPAALPSRSFPATPCGVLTGFFRCGSVLY